MSETVRLFPSQDVFRGGGELGALMRAHDWSATPLGPPASWPRSLQSIVRMMLTSRYQMWMAWGQDLTFFCNDAYRPTLGVKHPWALGKSARAVWAEIWPDISPLIEHVLATGEATYSEGMLLLLERSGFREETYHTFSYSPLFDDAGAIAGMFCVVVEETDRVISERRMDTLRKLASATAASPNELQLFTIVARELRANPYDLPFSLIYLFDDHGHSANLVAQSGVEASHSMAANALDLATAPWPLRQILDGTPAALVDNLGERFTDLPCGAWDAPPQQAIIVPIAPQTKDRRPAGAIIVGLNPRRTHDGAYNGFVELLAGQIGAALTAARAYEQERKRAEALAEIDRAKTTFFSNVSHEFRTPLTLMLGPLEEALATPTPPKETLRDHLELAHRNGVRLLRLVNSLLDFSRIEAGRVRANFVPTDISAFTAEIASSFRSTIERAGIALIVEAEAIGEPVYLDRDMWEKVLLNLISNAFKFTFEGDIRVVTSLTHDGRYARVRVSDTGIGIPSHELPRLFERFHRVEGARGRTFEGSGIGLALVHELVIMHGGSITAESTVGQGTHFVVDIPLGTSHLSAGHIRTAPSAHTTSGQAHAFVEEALRWLPDAADIVNDGAIAHLVNSNFAPPEATPGKGKRILLADDNTDMRDYVHRLLQARGYDVTAVGDGEAALAAAHSSTPDLILSDVMMPGLDGFGLLRAIRTDPLFASLPVILLSARAGEEAKVDGLAAGADDYLIKPFSARELLARVASNIQMADVRREAEAALRKHARVLETLNRACTAVAADLDLDKVVQTVTDAGVELTGAEFGAFFYNVLDESGESYMLYSLSGAPREAFVGFPMPRNTEVFAPTFSGESIVRSDDITRDPRYGRNAPRAGMPEGHLPVRSYLAVPVRSRAGNVLGGLFFGHSAAGKFDDSAEQTMSGLAAQAAIAIDNAQLFQSAQRELAQRRAAETELQAINATLEQRVASEVTNRLKAEEALRQAQKMEAVGQLTGGVAHDFNNLLTLIIGGLDTLRRIGPNDQGRFSRALDMATQGAHRAATLTARLLAFSRRQPLQPKPLDLNAVVRDAGELLHRTLGETIEIETVLSPRLWTADIDQNQLDNAILNLAVNARDAMPSGGKLTIETANTLLDESYVKSDSEVIPGQYVAISITDSGIGMPKHVLERVFEPFYTTKEVGRGTGLGLSMVYGFAKQSGGHVTIYSEEGHGTTVRLYFPRYRGDGNIEDLPSESSSPEAARDEVVLVVEDNQDVRNYSLSILSELGYGVIEAADAESAIRLLKGPVRIDILFTDIVLPGSNGRALADEALRIRPGLRILFTTGYSRNAIVHHGRLDAGVDLITKPFTFEQLATRIRAVLDS